MPPKNQRWWLTSDSVSVVVDAPADRIYDLVADMPRMGQWSNECARVEWTNGATAAAPDQRRPESPYPHWSPRSSAGRGRPRLLPSEVATRPFVTEEGAGGRRYRPLPVIRTAVTESYEVRWIPGAHRRPPTSSRSRRRCNTRSYS
jgi:hypothetical protein